jgi:hypothetical protein
MEMEEHPIFGSDNDIGISSADSKVVSAERSVDRTQWKMLTAARLLSAFCIGIPIMHNPLSSPKSKQTKKLQNARSDMEETGSKMLSFDARWATFGLVDWPHI